MPKKPAPSAQTPRMNEDVEIIACAGPPLCQLEGDEAVKNASDGCPLCTRITIGADGSETQTKAQSN